LRAVQEIMKASFLWTRSRSTMGMPDDSSIAVQMRLEVEELVSRLDLEAHPRFTIALDEQHSVTQRPMDQVDRCAVQVSKYTRSFRTTGSVSLMQA